MESTLPSYISCSSVMTALVIKRISTGVRSVTNTLQVYHRRLLDYLGVPEENTVRGYEERNDLPNHAHCKIKR